MNSSSRERRNPKSRSCGEDGGQIHSDLCGVKARNKSTTFQIASRLGPGTCEAIRAEGEEPSRATAGSDLNNNVWPSRVAFLGAIFLEKRAEEAIGCDRNDDQETADHPNGKHPHQKMRHEHEQRLEHWSRPKQTKSAGILSHRQFRVHIKLMSDDLFPPRPKIKFRCWTPLHR